MTYRRILQEATNKLKESQIIEYENDAWLLFEFIFDMSRHQYFMQMNDEETDEEMIRQYMEAIELRAKHMPVQYITETQNFMGLTFHVNENVLIPRFDTEILVEKALNILEGMETKKVNSVSRPLRVLDMCTGSGCIAISIAKLSKVPVEVVAVDVSSGALEIAKCNGEFNDVSNVKFIESNLFEKINENICGKNSKECGTMGASLLYDMIISNPPYIPSKVVDGLMPEVRDHEPRLALDGTEDGLWFYRRITEESVKYIREQGYLLYEIGCEQGESVSQMMTECGYSDIQIVKDLAGLDRVVLGRKLKKLQ
ncbi:MAG: peptide chain release factor N(5)-glutamine methyltransferase [Lachnospiraceae bacterium]|nr:peptide chain release factor N(5)-glutamine methyltransferase [Lachnospiraceae bacterium]